MRILVAGAAGQLARSLAETQGRDASLEIVCRGRPDLDLVDPASLARVVEALAPKVVVNAAAYTAVDKAEKDAAQAFAINATGAGALAEAAARIGAPIIHVSTDYVFDGTSTSPYRETDPTSPLGVYGASKLAGEEAVRHGNPRHVVMRTSWVHSPFGQNFVKTMLRLAGERPRLRVVADQTGNPTYAPHLADAVLAVARVIAVPDDRLPQGAWGTFHCAGSGYTTWHGFAEAIMSEAAACGAPSVAVDAITTAEFPTPARRPASSRLDCGWLAEVYGIVMPPYLDGVRECVAALAAERPQ